MRGSGGRPGKIKKMATPGYRFLGFWHRGRVDGTADATSAGAYPWSHTPRIDTQYEIPTIEGISTLTSPRKTSRAASWPCSGDAPR
jgi:hypothetical protein